MKRHRGLSLVEIMIALALSAMVIAGTLNVVASVKESQKLNDALGESQESGRIALSLLTDAITQSGYYGCLQPLSYTPQEDALLDWNNLQDFYIWPVAVFASNNLSKTSLRGFAVDAIGVWSPDPAANTLHDDVKALKTLTKPNTDVINVQFASVASVSLTEDMPEEDSSADVKVEPGLGITQSSYVIIGDCTQADLFKVTNLPVPNVSPMVLKHEATDPNTNHIPNLRNVYKKSTAQVRLFHNDTYYVADTGRQDSLGQPISSLMRMNIDGRRDEVIEGVDALKIAYGQQEDGSLQYLTADMPAFNARKVSQIQISVSIKTLKNSAKAESDNNGPYLKKEFKRTIQIRNRS